MPPKELNRHQLSSRLAYHQGETPAFLRKLQNRVKGIPDDEDGPQYYDEDGQEFYDDGSGRPPIPQRPSSRGERPPIPERPEGDAGSADEDDADEAPQVVVLKEGKHLSSRQVENERRKAKGLSPLPDDAQPEASDDQKTADSKSAKESSKSKAAAPSLSFSSGGAGSATKKKRKIVGGGAEDSAPEPQSKKPAKKKSKQTGKSLLSFGDDEV